MDAPLTSLQLLDRLFKRFAIPCGALAAMAGLIVRGPAVMLVALTVTIAITGYVSLLVSFSDRARARLNASRQVRRH